MDPSSVNETASVALPVREGEDYYIEGGQMVFTASYLRKCGYCCGSGCRHCPYRDAEGEAVPTAEG